MVQLEAALEPEHFHALFLRQPPLVLGAWLPIGEPPPVAPSMPLLPAADAACRPALACCPFLSRSHTPALLSLLSLLPSLSFLVSLQAMRWQMH